MRYILGSVKREMDYRRELWKESVKRIGEEEMRRNTRGEEN